MASTRFDHFTPLHSLLLRALGYVSLVALGLGLWGNLTRAAWLADDALMVDADRTPPAYFLNSPEQSQAQPQTSSR